MSTGTRESKPAMQHTGQPSQQVSASSLETIPEDSWEVIEEFVGQSAHEYSWTRLAYAYVSLVLEASYAGTFLQWWGQRHRRAAALTQFL